MFIFGYLNFLREIKIKKKTCLFLDLHYDKRTFELFWKSMITDSIVFVMKKISKDSFFGLNQKKFKIKDPSKGMLFKFN